jgi:uncharacterized protein YndB with AHSA1/START domain
MRIDVADGTVEIAVEIAASRERVWLLLTEQHHVHACWGGHVTLDARPGGSLREVWPDGVREVVTSGIVTRFEPPECLAMSWADDDWPGETRVSVSLAAVGNNATKLILVHAGWQIHPSSVRSRLMQDHAEGWSGHLARLAGYAEGREGAANQEETYR